MIEQYELFKIEYIDRDGYICIKCGVRQPENNFTTVHYENGTVEYKRTCNTCVKKHAVIRNELKKKYPYPDNDYRCPICDRNKEDLQKTEQRRLGMWYLDHCHDTGKFRGWLCHHCNTGLGALGDSIERVKNALNYLKSC